jgi:hypothetical protein
LALLPRVARNWPESGTFAVLRTGVNCLAIPGIVLGMITTGNVHLMSLWVLDAGNVVFYSGTSYLILGAWAKRRTNTENSSKHSQP